MMKLYPMQATSLSKMISSLEWIPMAEKRYILIFFNGNNTVVEITATI